MTASTLLVIPTYKERDNIGPLVDAIVAAGAPVDILVVDDNSPDGTADIAERHLSRARVGAVLRRHAPRSFAQSLRDGYRHALAHGYPRAAQMDADFSHAPSELSTLLAAAAHADAVIGSRYAGGSTRGWPLRRQLLSRLGNAYVRLVTGLRARDVTGGFRVYGRRALEMIDLDAVVSRGFSFQVEMTWRVACAGLSIAEVPITFVDRRRGSSKLTRAMILESLALPWRLRRMRPALAARARRAA